MLITRENGPSPELSSDPKLLLICNVIRRRCRASVPYATRHCDDVDGLRGGSVGTGEGGSRLSFRADNNTALVWGIACAVGGAVIQLFWRLYRIDNAKKVTVRAIEYNEKQLQIFIDMERDVLNEGFVFKRDEILTGEPTKSAPQADTELQAIQRSIEQVFEEMPRR